ncbi:hypothetical protein, partial [Erythrobacter westpacificensis]|uniref:hypothetical protein n=1 Tax=Erythrobacter westpacificensis TaxID=1055231 RepID=UPI0031F7A7A4
MWGKNGGKQPIHAGCGSVELVEGKIREEGNHPLICVKKNPFPDIGFHTSTPPQPSSHGLGKQ